MGKGPYAGDKAAWHDDRPVIKDVFTPGTVYGILARAPYTHISPAYTHFISHFAPTPKSPGQRAGSHHELCPFPATRSCDHEHSENKRSIRSRLTHNVHYASATRCLLCLQYKCPASVHVLRRSPRLPPPAWTTQGTGAADTEARKCASGPCRTHWR